MHEQNKKLGKEVETIKKKNPTETLQLKNIITKLKNTIKSLKSKLENAELVK